MVLVFVAFLMVALLGFVALTVDIGQLAMTRRQLQNAADAGAHAGAQVLPDYVPEAKDAATTWAYNNGLSGFEVSSTPVTMTNAANDTITVNVTRTVNYTFARALNLTSKDVTATATFVVGSVKGASGVMPFGLLDLNGEGTPGFGYDFGQKVTIKEVPGNSFNPGNYGFLALDGKGGDDLRETIGNGGSSTVYKIGDEVLTEPGQKTGPAREGLSDWAEHHSDTFSGSTCNDWATSHAYVNGKLVIGAKCQYRVVLIPIIDEWPDGRHEVTILGFAQMYIAGYNESNGKAIDAIFLDDSWSHPNITWGAIDSFGTRVVRMTK